MEQITTMEKTLNEKSSLFAKLELDWKQNEASFQKILATIKTESGGRDLRNLTAAVNELKILLKEKETLLESKKKVLAQLKESYAEIQELLKSLNAHCSEPENLDVTEQLKDVSSASEKKLKEFQSNVAGKFELNGSAMQCKLVIPLQGDKKSSLRRSTRKKY